MTFETISLAEFYLIGIAVRTSNENGQAQGDIGALWGRFMSQNLLHQIPNKLSNEIYCLYTSYENDFRGFYTTILGCPVHSLETIPAGFVGKSVPATTYQVYTSKGKLPDCIAKTWEYIWQTIPNRKYTADFDVYGPLAQNPEAAEVKTYLSVF